jgi:phosphatidylglycerophosphate synthase
MERYYDPDMPAKYAYKSVNDSIVNRFYARYWLPLAIRAIPPGMSANLVSIIGDVAVWIAFLLLSGVLAGPMSVVARPSPWLFGLVGLLLFFYHTMDCLDGIQARRTGSSGPLGEFVDHWFDSINAILVPLGLGLAFPGIPPLLVASSILLAGAAGWLSLRTTRNTGVLVFGRLSGEEGIFYGYAFCLAVWALGYDFWAAPGLFGLPRAVFAYAVVPLGFLASILATLKPAGRPDLFAIMVSSVLPLFAWTLLAGRRLGDAALLPGCLLLGFSLARFSGDVMRDRLVGLEYGGFFADLPLLGAALLLSELVPGLPSWLPGATAAAALVWTFAALAGQFGRTVARVREVLGVGLFGPPGAPSEARAEKNE